MGLFSQIILLKVKMAQSVQVFGRKKTATAVAFCKRGNGMIKVNGRPLDLVQPETLRMKVREPLLLLGTERFAGIDIRVRVKGGGQVAQLYAIRQAQRLLSLTIRSSWMNHPRKKSKIFWCSMIGL